MGTILSVNSRITKVGDSNYVLIPSMIFNQLGDRTEPIFTINKFGGIHVAFHKKPTVDSNKEEHPESKTGDAECSSQ